MEKMISERNPRWNNELVRYVLNGIEYLEKQSDQATNFLNIIVQKTGTPPFLIVNHGLSNSENVRHLKILYCWILEDNVGLARHDIAYFVGEDENTVHSYIEQHFDLLKSQLDLGEGTRYFQTCQKIFPYCKNRNHAFKSRKKYPFEIILKIDQRPLVGTSMSQDFIAELVIQKVIKKLGVTKEILISNSRKKSILYGRSIFMSIMKDFFPKMSCTRVGGYVNKLDHATVLNALRTHANLIESKNREYSSIYSAIYSECRNDVPVGDVDISSTVDGICEYLSSKQVSFEKIRLVKEALTRKLQSLYMFSGNEISQVLSRVGISKL